MEEGVDGQEAADGDVEAEPMETTGGLDPVFTPAFQVCLASWAERREAFRLHADSSPWPTDQPENLYAEALRLKQQLEDLRGVLTMTEEIEAVKPSLREALGVIKQRLSEGTAAPEDVEVLPLLLPFDCLRADSSLLTPIYECMHSAAQQGYADPQACYGLMLDSLAPRHQGASLDPHPVPLLSALDDLLARHSSQSQDAPRLPPSLLPYASLALSRLEVLARRVRREAVDGRGQGRDHRVAAIIDVALTYATQVQERIAAATPRQGVEAWAEERGQWEHTLQHAMHMALEQPALPSRVPLGPILHALSDPKAAGLYLACPYLHKCAMLRLTQAMAQAPSVPEARPLCALSLGLCRTLLQLRRRPISPPETKNPPHLQGPISVASGRSPAPAEKRGGEMGHGAAPARGVGLEEEGLLPGVYYCFHPYGSPTSRLLSTLLPLFEQGTARHPLDMAVQAAGMLRHLGQERGEGLVPVMLWQMAPHVLDVLYAGLGEDPPERTPGPDDVLLFLCLCHWVLETADEAGDSDEEMDTASTPPPSLLPLLPLLLPDRAAPTPQTALTMLQQILCGPQEGSQSGLVPLLVALLAGAAHRHLLPWTALADVVLAQEGGNGGAQWWLWLVMHDLCMRHGVDGGVGGEEDGEGMGLRTLAQRWDSQGGLLGPPNQGTDGVVEMD